MIDWQMNRAANALLTALLYSPPSFPLLNLELAMLPTVMISLMFSLARRGEHEECCCYLCKNLCTDSFEGGSPFRNVKRMVI